MPQRLDTGDQLNSQHGSEIIHIPQFLHRIPAPHIADVRLPFHLVGILRVKHGGVHSHKRHAKQKIPHDIGTKHSITGDIEHGSRLKTWCFPALISIFL